MTNQERQEKIENILSQIEPLSRRRIYVSTSFFFAKEEFNKTYADTDRQEVEKLKAEIASVEGQLEPLFVQLRQLQAKYLVEYEGEFINIYTGPTKEIYREVFYLTTDCNIDTFANGWNLADPVVNDLAYEVADFLTQHRFNQFTILNIKRLP